MEKQVLKFYTLEDANAFLALCKEIHGAGVKVDVSLERIPMIGSQEMVYRMECGVSKVEEPEVSNVGG